MDGNRKTAPIGEDGLKDGTLKSTVVGNKRLIDVKSYLNLMERLNQEQEGYLLPLGRQRGKEPVEGRESKAA